MLLAIVLAVASSIAFAQPKPKMTDEQALMALDKQWTAAELRLNDDDRKTIDRVVAVKRGTNWQLIQNHVSNIGDPPATP